MKLRILLVACTALCFSVLAIRSSYLAPAETHFESSYPAALDNGPTTGSRIRDDLEKQSR